jgi:hypothetical protein
VTLLVAAGPLSAQGRRPFEDLGRYLQPGDTVFVVERREGAGEGIVSSVTPAEIIVSVSGFQVPVQGSALSGSMGSRKGNRWKSVSRVQMRRMPCSRISVAVCVLCDVPRQPWHLRDNVRQHAYPLPVLILGVRREGSSPSCPVRGCTGRSGGGINRHLTGDQE